MLNEIAPKVKQVIVLASKCSEEYEKQFNGKDYIETTLSFDNIEDLAETENQKALSDYLFSLEYKDIEAIEAVMYIGRDKDFEEKQSPEEMFLDAVEYVRSLYGDGDKDMAIDYITGKAPLDEYLKEGLLILKQV